MTEASEPSRADFLHEVEAVLREIDELPGLEPRTATRLRIVAAHDPSAARRALARSDISETASFLIGQLIGSGRLRPQWGQPQTGVIYETFN